VSFDDATVYLVVSETHSGEWVSDVLAGWQGDVTVGQHGTFQAVTFRSLPFEIKEERYSNSSVSLGAGSPIPGALGTPLPFDNSGLLIGSVPGGLVISYTR